MSEIPGYKPNEANASLQCINCERFAPLTVLDKPVTFMPGACMEFRKQVMPSGTCDKFLFQGGYEHTLD